MIDKSLGSCESIAEIPDRAWPRPLKWLEQEFEGEIETTMQDEQDSASARLVLARLRLEHDDYHAAIDAMVAQKCDPLRIQRMKKKKLELKDRIGKVASLIIPDLPA